jgi:hypothetical protein
MAIIKTKAVALSWRKTIPPVVWMALAGAAVAGLNKAIEVLAPHVNESSLYAFFAAAAIGGIKILIDKLTYKG